MTLFYYMAAGRALPTGSFGKNKTTMTLNHYVTHVNPAAADNGPMQMLLRKYPAGEQLMEVYETELDAVGLFVKGPMENPGTEHPFKLPLIYEISPEGGSYKLRPEWLKTQPAAYAKSRKSLDVLLDYLRSHLEPGEHAELYACWANGKDRFEDPPKHELDTVLDLNAFTLDEGFDWQEHQYISVTR
ncbi:hypothetical protein [Paenibacillus methanolicus]|uniref:Uncharacterized protein n=1 Tax=Paenibacillus methanolicus TaxID=582686 RepID=A0A5S5BS25_9BACL|nr:hypothetical protein [Paenibacillus methanolicus]TYP69724.1 hypothetical protein BCM02_11354 [Paenibacillus methanolicus]